MCNMMKDLREGSKRPRIARDHVRTHMMSEMQSDPEQCKRVMLRAISPVQSPAVTRKDNDPSPTRVHQCEKLTMWSTSQPLKVIVH